MKQQSDSRRSLRYFTKELETRTMERFRSFLSAWLVVMFLIACTSVFAGTSDSPAAQEELRGTWLRPPSDTSRIPAILDDITTAGFNAVFVETFYHGFAIHAGSYVPRRPEFKDIDVLQTFITEGKKRGLQIHAWIETFYWAVDTEQYSEFPTSRLFEGHEEFYLRLREGTTTEKGERAHIFANPAHPQVRSFMVEYITELVETYDIDGVNIDYIRYSSGEEAGYDDYSRQAFQRAWGVDPLNIDPAKHEALARKWNAWRENQVTAFVRQLSKALDNTGKNVLLSADIFPGYYENKETHPIFQDWKTWVDLNLLDAIVPMAYGGSLDAIQREVNMVTSYTEQKPVVVFPGLAAPKTTADGYGGPGHPPLEEQISLMREMNIPGHVIFCYGWIKDSPLEFSTLRRSVYQK